MGIKMNDEIELVDDLNIELYKEIFEIIYENHNLYCNDWHCTLKNDINLKRKTIDDIYKDSENMDLDFLKYMLLFLKDLDSLQDEIIFYFSQKPFINVRSRIKGMDSILNKISIKKHSSDRGKIPINKCLNDLLGVRIIDDNWNKKLSYVKEYVLEAKNKGYRIKGIERELEGYKGYHIYFRGLNNKHFPIELQIWDKSDEDNNIKSHFKRKQNHLQRIEDYKKIERGK